MSEDFERQLNEFHAWVIPAFAEIRRQLDECDALIEKAKAIAAR